MKTRINILVLLTIAIVVSFCRCKGKTTVNVTGTQTEVALNQLPDATPEKLPRWRGFNLLEKFQDEPDSLTIIASIWSYNNQPFHEADFQMISEWGFNFVRLPMSYKCWIKKDNSSEFREDVLREIDQAVEWGKKYGLHVNINFHRAPGWCTNPPREIKSIWENDSVLNDCARHWAMFAKRYKGIPNSQLSFDLLNEPIASPEKYYKVVRRLCEAIRAVDPNRLIICDGNWGGIVPMQEFISLKVGQSGRAYVPGFITHYRASWAGWPPGREFTPPEWPGYDPLHQKYWDKQVLIDKSLKPWIELKKQGVGVHIGEWGVFNCTPKDVTLAFMEDVLSILKEDDIGWALWNFRGTFGVMDSYRADVVYEDYKGHRLDRDMLTLLQKY